MPEEVAVKTWRELSRQFAALSWALESALKEQHELGMSEFEVLDRLVEDEHRCLRMQELGELIHLSQSALSRTVARLEKDGLVERALCATDRRGVYVRLTDPGQQRHAEARPTHRRVINDTLRG
ncbi:MarR family winged helix-turn-helix transcriptional regulator [Catellatospora bangladeshensis]|uniref:MarR family transcriptional regulator n=1 Tax=Catellatospora bangladeshensis TaxID=310355 RepID=A0A8J3JKS8_9ACTN|nr:MarR family transcriptional regulator [Catellatospora bangladeshensis]GIF78939.1 MarR family transcriptional regulator [Catellatospora bangladeshensis]